MVDSKLPANLSPDEKRARLAELLKRKASESFVETPLSYGQRALWFIYQLEPGSSAYNISLSLRLRQPVDTQALRRAVDSLIQRHGSLRTTFRSQEGAPIRIVRSYVESPFQAQDVRGCTEETLLDHVLSAHRRPFDLEKGPVCRAVLFTVSDTDHVFLFGAHHVVVDGRSLGILLEELIQAYQAALNGKEPTLLPATCEYTSFIEWQANTLKEHGQKMEAAWREALSGPLPVLDLAADHARPAVQSFRGEAVSFQLASSLASDLTRVIKAEGVTLFGLLIAAYFVLLHRYSGQTDIIVGSPAIGRSRKEFERVVGYFVNPVALRASLDGDPTVRAFLREIRALVQRALANQDYPFPLLVERLQPERASNRPPVFQVMFNVMRVDWLSGYGADTAQPSGGSAALVIEPYAIPQEEGQFDLALDMVESGQRLGGLLRYSSDLFDRATAERMVEHYITLLASIAAAPETRLSELSMLSSEERARLAAWNATDAPYDRDQGVETMFVAHALRAPDGVAIEMSGTTWRYRDVNAAANRLAARLLARGVGPDTLVGVCLERSPEMVVVLLGILKAGAAYVPLDPAFPSQRLALMAEDAQLKLIIVDEESRRAAPQTSAELLLVSDAIAGADDPGSSPSPARGEHLAYVLYTSGSTGRPKGVEVPRRALTNFIRSMQQQPGMKPTDRLLAVTTLSFDISGLELFLPLSVGATVVIASRDEAIDGSMLLELLQRARATIMQATPATWRMLINGGWSGSPGLKVLCGGEALAKELAPKLLARAHSVWNMYGPTETTIWSTVNRVQGPEDVSIGRPILNTQVHVVSPHDRLLPMGVPGELCIGGDGVAHGYLHQPELTRQRFVPDPFATVDGMKMYRTGDLARWLPDGRLECLGRLDHQVKVNGFRIELGEVESALERHEAIRQAVATVFADSSADRRLVAYIVFQPGGEATTSELRRFIRQYLPDYMVPALFVTMDAFPLTPNGKVDRRALPPPLATDRRKTRIAPRSPMEQTVAAVWQHVLGVPDVSIYDNFFEIGGHSLLAMQAVSLLEQRSGVRLHPSHFIMDTLEQVSTACELASKAGESMVTSVGPAARGSF